MKPETGILLRLLGPLLQIICAAMLLRTWDDERTFAGIPLKSLLMLGFFVGMCMVVAGLTLVKRRARTRRTSNDLDLDAK